MLSPLLVISYILSKQLHNDYHWIPRLSPLYYHLCWHSTSYHLTLARQQRLQLLPWVQLVADCKVAMTAAPSARQCNPGHCPGRKRESKHIKAVYNIFLLHYVLLSGSLLNSRHFLKLSRNSQVREHIWNSYQQNQAQVIIKIESF